MRPWAACPSAPMDMPPTDVPVVMPNDVPTEPHGRPRVSPDAHDRPWMHTNAHWCPRVPIYAHLCPPIPTDVPACPGHPHMPTSGDGRPPSECFRAPIGAHTAHGPPTHSNSRRMLSGSFTSSADARPKVFITGCVRPIVIQRCPLAAHSSPFIRIASRR